MKEITMVELRLQTAKVIRALRERKEKIRLFYRGRALADLVPVDEEAEALPAVDDPLYTLSNNAVQGNSVTNKEIDKLVYS